RVWDTDCFRHFRGMFGLGIWIQSQRRLVLARDRVGIKPLFFYRAGDDILFGSEIKAILQHPAVHPKISTNALDCFLSLNYVPASFSMVHGIQKLPPGCFLEWVDGNSRVCSYWRFTDTAPKKWTLHDAKEEFDHLLRESVREHLIADVPVSVWLSGG